MNKAISGFSKLSKEEKIKWIANEYFSTPGCRCLLKNYWNSDENYSNYDEFIENTITNFYIPLGVAPNFLINGKYSTIPMGDSVVAAQQLNFGSALGFITVLNTEKWNGFILQRCFQIKLVFCSTQNKFFSETESITTNMQKRGGGILDIILKEKTDLLPNYFQLHATLRPKTWAPISSIRV
jgi:hydroxymethylglutaryl-CoA reductase